MRNPGKKVMTLLTAIFGVLAIGIGAYYLSRTDGSNEADRASRAWKSYTNVQYGFSFQYPPDLVPVTDTPDLFSYYTDQTNRVYLDFPISDTMASTTGIEGAISFGVSPEATSSCAQLGGRELIADDTLSPLVKVTINDMTFGMINLSRCAAGGCLDIYQYSIVKNGLCYRADLAVSDGPPLDDATPEAVSEVQTSETDTELQSIFHRVMATFIFHL